MSNPYKTAAKGMAVVIGFFVVFFGVCWGLSLLGDAYLIGGMAVAVLALVYYLVVDAIKHSNEDYS